MENLRPRRARDADREHSANEVLGQRGQRVHALPLLFRRRTRRASALCQRFGFSAMWSWKSRAVNSQLSLPDGDNGRGIESLADDGAVAPPEHVLCVATETDCDKAKNTSSTYLSPTQMRMQRRDVAHIQRNSTTWPLQPGLSRAMRQQHSFRFPSSSAGARRPTRQRRCGRA